MKVFFEMGGIICGDFEGEGFELLGGGFDRVRVGGENRGGKVVEFLEGFVLLLGFV